MTDEQFTDLSKRVFELTEAGAAERLAEECRRARLSEALLVLACRAALKDQEARASQDAHVLDVLRRALSRAEER